MAQISGQSPQFYTQGSSPAQKTQNKHISETKETPQSSTIRSTAKSALKNIGNFFKKLAENCDCKNHYLTMRASMKKTAALAKETFNQIKENVKKGTEEVLDNKVFRKLKDIYNTLKKGGFYFVRSSKTPFIEIVFDSSIMNLLKQYQEYEENQSSFSMKEELDEIIELLLKIGEQQFPEDLFQVRNAMVAELITKYLVAIPLQKGMAFPIPSFTLDHDPRVISYQVSEVFMLGNSGIPVYIFDPLEEEDQRQFASLLVFRGTKFSLKGCSDMRSVIENLNRAGPARGLYDLFKGILKGYFDDRYEAKPNNDMPKFRILGYSQGAVLGQRAVIDFYPYLETDILQSSVLLNSPGLENDYMQRWLEIPNEQRPYAINILTTNDIVSKRGHQFIGQIYEVEPNHTETIMEAHLGAKTIAQSVTIFQVHNERESESESRKLVNEIMTSNLIEGLYQMLAAGLEKLQSKASYKDPVLILQNQAPKNKYGFKQF